MMTDYSARLRRLQPAIDRLPHCVFDGMVSRAILATHGLSNNDARGDL